MRTEKMSFQDGNFNILFCLSEVMTSSTCHKIAELRNPFPPQIHNTFTSIYHAQTSVHISANNFNYVCKTMKFPLTGWLLPSFFSSTLPLFLPPCVPSSFPFSSFIPSRRPVLNMPLLFSRQGNTYIIQENEPQTE